MNSQNPVIYIPKPAERMNSQNPVIIYRPTPKPAERKNFKIPQIQHDFDYPVIMRLSRCQIIKIAAVSRKCFGILNKNCLKAKRQHQGTKSVSFFEATKFHPFIRIQKLYPYKSCTLIKCTRKGTSVQKNRIVSFFCPQFLPFSLV